RRHRPSPLFPYTTLFRSSGFSWGDYLDALVTHHGTLTALAWRLVQAGDFADDVGSVERGLRRLRGRGQRDGGEWGRRLLRLCGVDRKSTRLNSSHDQISY